MVFPSAARMAAAAAVAGRIPKPNMNNLNRKFLYKNILQGMAVAWTCAFAYKVFAIDPYYEKVKKFYETYDPFEEFERMRNLGLFQCCPPDYILEEMAKEKKQKKK